MISRARRSALLLVAASTCAVLVGTLLIPAEAAEAAPAAWGEVPVVESAPLMEVASSTPAGEFTFDELPASAPDLFHNVPDPVDPEAEPGYIEGLSEASERTEFTTTYTNADGTTSSVLSSAAVNLQVDGEWVDIETAVAPVGDGTWEVDTNPLNPVFAKHADEEGVFSVTNGDFDVTFTLAGADDSQLARTAYRRTATGSDTVRYPDVFDGVDLEYVVGANQVKETLVLEEVPAADPSYVWQVSAPGLTLSMQDNGDISFVDERGVEQFLIPAPLMWDSSGVAGVSEDASTLVETELARDGERWSLTLLPSPQWLGDAAREYPVYVDPTVATSQLGADGIASYKSDGTTGATYVQIGNTNETSGGKYWRSIVHYTYQWLFGNQVVDTAISAAVVSGTPNGYTGSVWQGICCSYAGNGAYLSAMWTDSTGVGQDTGLDLYYAEKMRTSNNDGYVLLVGAETPGTYTYKRLNTALWITSKGFPSAPTMVSPSPASGSVGPLAPTLKASSSSAGGFPLKYMFKVSTATGAGFDAGVVNESVWSDSAEYKVPQTALAAHTTYYWRAYVKDDYDGWLGTSTVRASTATWSWTTNAPAPSPAQASALPVDGSVLTNLTPTFSTAAVVDPDSAVAVKYNFRVATGADGVTGAIAQSGWLTSPTWTPPVGVLQDGGSYTWLVETDDGAEKWQSWVNKFTVNQRLGSSGPSPYDSAGPVTVNLASGNVSLGFSSPTVGTVGGPMGMAFSYNSLQSPTKFRGLTARYYDAGQSAPTYTFAGKAPVLVRIDPQVSFDWAIESPGPAVPIDNFLASWSGFIRVPSPTAQYSFGVVRDGGAKVTLAGTAIITGWNENITTTPTWTAPQTVGGSPVSIGIEYYESTGNSKLELWVKAPDGPDADTAPDIFIVPSDWFTTTYAVLPAGWSSSTPIAGASGAYVSAAVSEASIAITDVSGAVHTYVKTSGGGYTSPVGEYGVLSLDSTGLVVLSEDDGTVYTFDALGKLSSSTSPADALKPATPLVTYRAGTGQPDRISDRLSATTGTPVAYDRYVRFVYSGDTTATTGLPAADLCPTLSGYSAAPVGMLCRIIYPGHTIDTDTTRLYYTAAGQLARIVDPGGVTTIFAYNTEGRVETIRDSLANDWLAANTAITAGPAQATTILYDVQGRATSVTLPAPDGATIAARPSKTYAYGAGTTTVDVVGLTLDSGQHAKTVTYDSAWRQLTVTSPSGLTASQVWSAKDQVLSATDAQGLISTTIYNAQDRVTDSYGPAPAACFGADRLPLGTCPILPAHTSTSYDAGLQGLHAAYYANSALSGSPKIFDLFNSAADGSVSKDWLASSPVAPTVDAWGLRLSGLVSFPTAGTYTFTTSADDATRVWVDDKLVVNSWEPGALRTAASTTPVIVAIAGQQARIRVEYADISGNAKLELQWKTIAAPTFVTVPGAALSPDYGLANGTHLYDSALGALDASVPDLVTSLEYTHPWLGAVTKSIVDPGGLNLATDTTYETPGTGWLRRLTKRLPAAVLTNSPASTAGLTLNYWGDKQQLGSVICDLPATTPQHGFLKSSTSPTPATGSAVVTEYVYDLWGRTVGTKRTGDTTWTCASFDARGRSTSTVFSAYGASPTRTATYNYAVGGNPLVSSASDPAGTVASTIDLLGRTVSSTDVWGTTTTPTYEALTGRVLSTSTTIVGQSATTQSFTYNVDGQVESVSVGGTLMADPTYTAGILTGVTYANGTALTGGTADDSVDSFWWVFQAA